MTVSAHLKGPTMPASEQSTAFLPAGAHSPQRGPGVLASIVIGAAVGTLALLWSLFPANYRGLPGIQAETIAWKVHHDNAVQISYAVGKLKGDTVRCVVDAYDADFAVIAEKELIIPTGTTQLRQTETLTTPHRATGARIRSCRSLNRT